MPSAAPSLTPDTVHLEKDVQLVYLCTLRTAANESCRDMNNIKYASGNSNADHHLTPFQIFLCKLAQICDTRRGGDTITAMVALKGTEGTKGPTYLFASNNRKEVELHGMKELLVDLLSDVRNLGNLADKALQRHVLWRVLEFGFDRVESHIRHLLDAIAGCIEKCSQRGEASGSSTIMQLRQLEERAKFPCDMSGDNAKSKFLSDCSLLLKAIQSAKESNFGKTIEDRARDEDPDASLPWRELRHHLGRLHSYRQAADSIVNVAKDRPEMVTNFTIDYISSSKQVKLPMPRPSPSPPDLIQDAFPDLIIDDYECELDDLREHGLDRNIRVQLYLHQKMKRLVHCEVLLHDYLVRQKVDKPTKFWNDSMFIATSKPPCRLCDYYFKAADNNFQVQSSHGNTYPRWRLPDINKEEGAEAVERQQELLEEIVEQLELDTLKLLKEKEAQWKRWDSATGWRTAQSVAPGPAGLGRGYAASSSGSPESVLGPSDGNGRSSSPADGSDYSDVGVAL
ncbi:hypothetical protein B0T11DRAFT_353880 [Plectosphaerella cucumerina]|uniref:Uncharacterized protein n=1 Tax=Plectosphaerella cucumerina TaxID=40658 RepID=A0A8K0TH55_9PEZI|nr:hypothetical protein B0T11DRAFT_353880 [Plectosphaerella cucumerina]